PPRPPPFPYTTLFRSARPTEHGLDQALARLGFLVHRGVERAEVIALGVEVAQLDRPADVIGRGVLILDQLVRGHHSEQAEGNALDRKSTRLNSSHLVT